MGVFKYISILGLASWVQGQSLDCIQRGQCTESLYVGDVITYDVKDCLGFCQADADCEFFNYNEDTNECFKLANCVAFDQSCSNCYSGSSSCEEPTCWVSGARCNGNEISNFPAQTSNDCILACKADPLCQWFSFDNLSSECQLTEDCQQVDETCTSCVYGQALCNQRDNVIIVSGGNHGSGYLTDFEVINLSNPSSTCETIENFPYGIYGHVLEVVDGVLKVCGGTNGENAYLCHDYDFDKRSWKQSPGFSEYRYRHRASFIDGVWLISGSSGTYTAPNSTEMWTDKKFVYGPPLPEEMEDHCQITLNATHVFFANSHGNKNTYILEWETLSWVQLESMETWRDDPTCGLIYNEDNGYEVVVVGDGTSEIFNVATETWRSGPPLPEPDYYLGEAQLSDTFAVAGGWAYAGTYYPVDTIYIFDNVNYDWILSDQHLRRARYMAGVTSVPPDFLNCS